MCSFGMAQGYEASRLHGGIGSRTHCRTIQIINIFKLGLCEYRISSEYIYLGFYEFKSDI